MLNLFNPRIWLAFVLTIIVSVSAGAYWGYRYEKQAQQVTVAKVTVSDTETARNKEQVATETLATMGANLTNQLNAQKANTENEIAMLKAKLAKAGTCTVPGAAVGMLYASTGSNLSTSSAIGFGTGSTATYADSSCGEQLELAARNYREVCEPNAEQLKALQDAYSALREQYNTPTDK
jgi:hypothetical protein